MDNLSIDVTCSTKTGAALIIRSLAYRADTLAPVKFKRMLIENGNSWLAEAIARGKMFADASLEQLVLVTGCDLTTDWANVVFMNGSSSETAKFRSTGSVTSSTWGGNGQKGPFRLGVALQSLWRAKTTRVSR